MAKKVISVKGNQTILDIAMQEYGSIEGAYSIIADNNIESIDELLTPGDELVIDSDMILNKDVLSFYRRNKVYPASADESDAEISGDAFTLGFSLGFES